MVNPFVVIVDRDGDAVELVGGVSPNVPEIIKFYDSYRPNDAPHTAWEWRGKNVGWQRVEA